MRKVSKKWILVCGIIVFVIAAACLYGIFRTGSNVHMQEAETEQTGEPGEELEQASEAEQKPEQTPEPEEDLDSAGETMPKIVDAIADEEKVTALCEDGSVWSWDRESGEKSAVRVEGFRDVKKIMHAGSAVYALAEDGHVYVWGNDKCLRWHGAGEEPEYYEEAQAVPGLADIVDMDANVDPYPWELTRAFAIDREGNLYGWGMYMHISSYEEHIPMLLNEDRKEGVVSAFVGAGRYHYFIRENGTVFSIMDDMRRIMKDEQIRDSIFPMFPIAKPETEQRKPLFYEDIPYEELGRGEFGFVISYELGSDGMFSCIDADRYTVFMAREDGSLWYWNSRMIPFHDFKDAIADLDSCKEDYGGNWARVTVEDIAGMPEEGGEALPVADIRAGKENVLFLMEDGQVFVSEYATYETRDVEYWYIGNGPGRSGLGIARDLNLKELSFRKLEWENIVSINTDGTYYFTAVDADGGCFYLDMEPEE